MKWLIALLFVASAQGAFFEDPSGDVFVEVYEQTSQPLPAGYEPADLRALDIEEDPSEIRWSVSVQSFAAQPGAQWDGGDLRSHFEYGDMRYMVQMGLDLGGSHYAFLHEKISSNEFEVQPLATLAFEADATTLTAIIPRDLVVDEQGTPPLAGRSLTNIWVNSYSQTSFGGPSPDFQDQQDLLTVRDNMPNDLVGGSYTFVYGGTTAFGDLWLESADPYRASNGGQARITYYVDAFNNGTEPATLTISLRDVPLDWNIYWPNGTLVLGAGEHETIPVVVETPAGHNHGGMSRFYLKIQSGTQWSETDLGIHYLTVAQPSGHHPTLWFHSQGALTFTGPIGTLFGGPDGTLSMNTLDEAPADAKVAVQGEHAAGSDTYRWAICLSPDLRMGLDFNLTRIGELDLALTADRPFAGVRLSGSLVYYEPGPAAEICTRQQLSERSGYEVASLAAVTHDVNGATSFQLDVTPVAEGDYIPYVKGASMALLLDASTTTPTTPGSTGLRIAPGGQIELPLDEYFDASPGGLVGGQVQENGTVDNSAFEAAPEDDKKSPLPLLVPALVVAAALRRR